MRVISEKVQEARLKAKEEKGCAFWLAEVNKPNCSFPECFCFPFWRKKYGL